MRVPNFIEFFETFSVVAGCSKMFFKEKYKIIVYYFVLWETNDPT